MKLGSNTLLSLTLFTCLSAYTFVHLFPNSKFKEPEKADPKIVSTYPWLNDYYLKDYTLSRGGDNAYTLSLTDAFGDTLVAITGIDTNGDHVISPGEITSVTNATEGGMIITDTAGGANGLTLPQKAKAAISKLPL